MTWPTAIVMVVLIVACAVAYGWHLDRQPDEYDDSHDEIIDWFRSANGRAVVIYADGTVGTLRRASDEVGMQIDTALGIVQQRASGSISGGIAPGVSGTLQSQQNLPFPPIHPNGYDPHKPLEIRPAAAEQYQRP